VCRQIIFYGKLKGRSQFILLFGQEVRITIFMLTMRVMNRNISTDTMEWAHPTP
jgi:hypothetical protein